MPHQVAVTVRAPVLPGRREALEEVLRGLRAEGDRLPFSRLKGTHFARLFVLDGFVPDDGPAVPDSLVYMADVDGSARAHLLALATTVDPSLDVAFCHCADYPQVPTPLGRVAWLQQHALQSAAYYVHAVGRSCPQVQAEARLQDELADVADALPPEAARTSPQALRRTLLHTLLQRPGWAWACRPARGAGLLHRGREVVHALAVPLLLLPLLPVLLPALATVLLLVRLQERTDVPHLGPPDPDHVARVEACEDVGAQNAFTAAGPLKPGRVRHAAVRVALYGLDYACRHVYSRDQLAGVRTIHFARWMFLDDDRRVLFASAYDGSQESYMDDFIDRLSWGVNLVFSNGVGYPRTRWLVLDGARDEVSYKQYLRTRQVPTTVFFSAYDTLPATHIDSNARLRAGVAHAADEQEAARWLMSL
ncbi:MAG: hypothetical protein JWM64_55 [Frankiales bacterium]|nr:hypothetical protein [Frankiales bacterium]